MVLKQREGVQLEKNMIKRLVESIEFENNLKQNQDPKGNSKVKQSIDGLSERNKNKVQEQELENSENSNESSDENDDENEQVGELLGSTYNQQIGRNRKSSQIGDISGLSFDMYDNKYFKVFEKKQVTGNDPYRQLSVQSLNQFDFLRQNKILYQKNKGNQVSQSIKKRLESLSQSEKFVDNQLSSTQGSIQSAMGHTKSFSQQIQNKNSDNLTKQIEFVRAIQNANRKLNIVKRKQKAKEEVKLIDEDDILQNKQLLKQLQELQQLNQSKSHLIRKKNITQRRNAIKSDTQIQNLPNKLQIQQNKLKNTPFLKMHQGKNSIHEGDRERASSIVMNLVFRPSMKYSSKYDYFFNKKEIKEEKAQLTQDKLLELGQLSEETYNQKKKTKSKYQLKFLEYQETLRKMLSKKNIQMELNKKKNEEQFIPFKQDEIMKKDEVTNKSQIVEGEKLSNNRGESLNSREKQFKSRLHNSRLSQQEEGKSQKLVDSSIIQSSMKDGKMMSFYFDKFNMKFKDINPFHDQYESLDEELKKRLRNPKDEFSLYSKNLNRQQLYQKQQQKRIEILQGIIDRTAKEKSLQNEQKSKEKSQQLQVKYYSHRKVNTEEDQKRVNVDEGIKSAYSLQENFDKFQRQTESQQLKTSVSLEQQKLKQQQESQQSNIMIENQEELLSGQDSKRIKRNALYNSFGNRQSCNNPINSRNVIMLTSANNLPEEYSSSSYQQLKLSTQYNKKMINPNNILIHSQRNELKSAQDIRNKIVYKNKGFLFLDQQKRWASNSKRNDNQQNNISIITNQFPNRDFKNRVQRQSSHSRAQSRGNVFDRKPKSIANVNIVKPFYDSNTSQSEDNNFPHSSPSSSSSSSESENERSKSRQRSQLRSRQRKNNSNSIKQCVMNGDLDKNNFEMELEDIKSQYKELRNDIYYQDNEMKYIDQKSQKLIDKLDNELVKQKKLLQEVDIYGSATNEFDDYFNIKIKTFFINEKKKINFYRQKLDYMINKIKS